MITGFDHIQIYCGDAEKAVAFFRDIFGGKEIAREKRDTPLIRRLGASFSKRCILSRSTANSTS